MVRGGVRRQKLSCRRIRSAATRGKTAKNGGCVEGGGGQGTAPGDVTEAGGSERAAELKREDRR